MAGRGRCGKGGTGGCPLCRAMNSDVKAPGVFLVAHHLQVLEESGKDGHAPTEPLGVRLHQDDLVDVDDEEETTLGIGRLTTSSANADLADGI